MKSHIPIALKASVLAVACLLSACAGLPIYSEDEVEAESSVQFRQMRANMPVSTDAGERNYVICVARAIIAELEEPYSLENWEVEIFDDPNVNAFAMPGGKIGVFNGILVVADDQDQLGAVLGHEVAHVTEQHALERANAAATTQGGAMVVGAVLGGGAAGGAVQDAAMLGITLPYGRKQESEADVEGLKYSAAAGFDPRASVTLWQNMDKTSSGAPPEFLSTHPSGDTRIQDLVEQLPEALVLYNEAKAQGKNPNCGP